MQSNPDNPIGVFDSGVGGLTVKLAGSMYDAQGGFDLLYALFGAAAILAALVAIFLPGRRRPDPVPVGAD